MAENSNFEGMDPELAALLGAANHDNTVPDFNDIFGDTKETESPMESEETLGSTGFPQVTKRLEEKGHHFFDDPNYYKAALSNEGDIAQRVHTILQKFLTTKDPKDRGVFRQQLITPYWEFLFNVGRKAAGKIHHSKKYLLRFNQDSFTHL